LFGSISIFRAQTNNIYQVQTNLVFGNIELYIAHFFFAPLGHYHFALTLNLQAKEFLLLLIYSYYAVTHRYQPEQSLWRE
jgi:hypothetical protein